MCDWVTHGFLFRVMKFWKFMLRILFPSLLILWPRSIVHGVKQWLLWWWSLEISDQISITTIRKYMLFKNTTPKESLKPNNQDIPHSQPLHRWPPFLVVILSSSYWDSKTSLWAHTNSFCLQWIWFGRVFCRARQFSTNYVWQSQVLVLIKSFVTIK